MDPPPNSPHVTNANNQGERDVSNDYGVLVSYGDTFTNNANVHSSTPTVVDSYVDIFNGLGLIGNGMRVRGSSDHPAFDNTRVHILVNDSSNTTDPNNVTDPAIRTSDGVVLDENIVNEMERMVGDLDVMNNEMHVLEDDLHEARVQLLIPQHPDPASPYPGFDLIWNAQGAQGLLCMMCFESLELIGSWRHQQCGFAVHEKCLEHALQHARVHNLPVVCPTQDCPDMLTRLEPDMYLPYHVQRNFIYDVTPDMSLLDGNVADYVRRKAHIEERADGTMDVFEAEWYSMAMVPTYHARNAAEEEVLGGALSEQVAGTISFLRPGWFELRRQMIDWNLSIDDHVASVRLRLKHLREDWRMIANSVRRLRPGMREG